MKTKSGIPVKINSPIHLLRILKRKGGAIQYIPTHYNSEKGTALIHEAMYSLEKSKLVTIIREDIVINGQYDVLFKLRLTVEGIDNVNKRVKHIITVLIAIISIMVTIILKFLYK